MRKTKKMERQNRLKEILEINPFCTDAELADQLGASVQTIRLDRTALHIPELRERTKQVAENTFSQVKSLRSEDFVGELIDLDLNESGISVMETTDDMTYADSNVVKGYYVFSHASSLAIAIIDANVALIGLANIKFRRPVLKGEKLVAKAKVIRQKTANYVVQVVSKVNGEQVFRGKFVVFLLDSPPMGRGELGYDTNRG